MGGLHNSMHVRGQSTEYLLTLYSSVANMSKCILIATLNILIEVISTEYKVSNVDSQLL